MATKDKSALRATGGCLCGAVRYKISGALREVVNCHCGQCLRTHGHFAAYSAVDRDKITLIEDRGLKWFVSSDIARRGFCQDCGASLFWDGAGQDYLSVAAGCLDMPTGLKTLCHIFVANKGDYYDIADGLDQLPAGRAGTSKGGD